MKWKRTINLLLAGAVALFTLALFTLAPSTLVPFTFAGVASARAQAQPSPRVIEIEHV
jgi:hypothetical protein